MWRRQGDRQETVPLAAGTCVSIPAGTQFQFRSSEDGPLTAVAVTMPPWPGQDEAYKVSGKWSPDPGWSHQSRQRPVLSCYEAALALGHVELAAAVETLLLASDEGGHRLPPAGL